MINNFNSDYRSYKTSQIKTLLNEEVQIYKCFSKKITLEFQKATIINKEYLGFELEYKNLVENFITFSFSPIVMSTKYFTSKGIDIPYHIKIQIPELECKGNINNEFYFSISNDTINNIIVYSPHFPIYDYINKSGNTINKLTLKMFDELNQNILFYNPEVVEQITINQFVLNNIDGIEIGDVLIIDNITNCVVIGIDSVDNIITINKNIDLMPNRKRNIIIKKYMIILGINFDIKNNSKL